MNCKDCGGTMIGDGVTTPLHCEFVDTPADREADAPPLFCGLGDEPDAGHEDDSSYPASWGYEKLDRNEAEIPG